LAMATCPTRVPGSVPVTSTLIDGIVCCCIAVLLSSHDLQRICELLCGIVLFGIRQSRRYCSTVTSTPLNGNIISALEEELGCNSRALSRSYANQYRRHPKLRKRSIMQSEPSCLDRS
jgi:hypothetical protein